MVRFIYLCNPRVWGILNKFHVRQYSPDQALKENKKLESLLHVVTGLPIVHHDGYECNLPPNHSFPMKKFQGVLRQLIADNVVSHEKQVVEPDSPSLDELCSVHTQSYVEKFFAGTTSETEQKRTGFKWSSDLVQRCRLETGGTILTAQIALKRGLACSTAGGTHHAFPDHGSGFCLLNDLAVAAKLLLDSQQVSKVLIIDLDVHQGDGTAYIFERNENVFTFSMHCEDNFPLRKQQSDLDVGLEAGVKDRRYIAKLKEYLPWVIDTFRPDLILYDAGVDPHQDDDLGKLSLSDQGLFERDLFVINLAISKGISCACVIGGGYYKDLDILSIRHTIMHRAATKDCLKHHCKRFQHIFFFKTTP